MKFPALLESWRYRNPEAIADGLIAQSEKKRKAAERKAELHRKHKGRRIRSLVRQAKKNGGSSID